LARFCSAWRPTTPSGILGNGARIHRRSKPSLTIWQVSDQNAIRLDCAKGFNQCKSCFVPKVWSRVHPIKSSRMVPPDTTHELAKVIRAKVPVVTGPSNVGAPLAMDFSMADPHMALRHLTMRTMFILGCKTLWRLINSSWTRSFTLPCRPLEGHMMFFT
jgi:hypothetical protein